MMILAPLVAVLALLLLAGLVVTSLSHPLVLAYGAAVTIVVTRARDRRLAIGLAAVAILVLALILWTGAQPGYIGVGR